VRNIVCWKEFSLPTHNFFNDRMETCDPGSPCVLLHPGEKAPAGKRMFWFENSAHVPFIEERSAFHAVMINSVLGQSGE
jgi:hypothetical protein